MAGWLATGGVCGYKRRCCVRSSCRLGETEELGKQVTDPSCKSQPDWKSGQRGVSMVSYANADFAGEWDRAQGGGPGRRTVAVGIARWPGFDGNEVRLW